MALQTALTRLFDLQVPIIQAPMAGSAGGDLAREVSRAGGLGMIGTGTKATPAFLAGEWAKLDGTAPVGVGFMTWALPQQQQLFTYALSLRPAAVLLSFDDPQPYAAAIHAAGARLICQVQTVADAVRAAAAGADLLIAQGTEAGGHTGHVGTLPLLSAILAEVSGVPVAEAGGVGDGRALAGAIAMGACGAMMGTRFVATPESLTPPAAKERILQATEADTVLTRVFDMVQGIPWPSSYPGRALKNGFTAQWHGREAELEQQMADARTHYGAARERMDMETLAIYAGQVSGQIRELVPAGELVRQIGAEAEAALRGA